MEQLSGSSCLQRKWRLPEDPPLIFNHCCAAGTGLTTMLFTKIIGGAALLLNGAYAGLAPWFPGVWILNGLLVALFTYGMYTVYSYMNENLYVRILRNY